MAALRSISRKIFIRVYKSDLKPKLETCVGCTRLLHYSSIEYNEKPNPAPKFFNPEIQTLLKELTRADLSSIFKKRRLGTKQLEDPIYKFMTDEELKIALEEAKLKSDEMLQIPPVVAVRQPIDHILSKDPALQGLDDSKMVFTDITFGIRDSDRVIVVREPDGTLKDADWDIRDRINQLYFPKKQREIKPPRMFYGEYFDNLLERKEYIFILDRACVQFEPDDPDYQRIVSITYQHINEDGNFDMLRSTRHFGALTFFLVWHRNIDNLLLELVETCHIEEANKLLELYEKIHDSISFDKGDEVTAISDYISRFSSKKSALELGVQAYKELSKQKEEYEKGINIAHGVC